ncbi:response regulator [Thalassotalea maritima]|uniref:response regulator n=1 Tax=Thalassotalea maritima TaxID=3242416 RepID=UPI0035278244
MYNESILAAVVLLIGLLVFVVYKVRQQTQQELSLLLANSQAKQLITGVLMIFLLIISILINYGLHTMRKQMQHQASESLATVAETTHSSLQSWYHGQIATLRIVADDPLSTTLIESLLTANAEQLVTNSDLQQLRQLYNDLSLENRHVGFFVIGKDHINYGSLRDSNLGETNLLSTQAPELLAQAFAGKNVVVGPLRSDVSLHDVQKGLGAHNTTMFVVGPVYDQQRNIIAVMALRIDPYQELYPIIASARVGKSGETYLVNKQGVMVSASRFEKRLAEIGLIADGQSSILSIELRNPGRQLSADIPFNDDTSPNQLPLTYSAEKVLSQQDGQTSKAYTDYRGIEVLGAWRWLDELGVGVISEIDLDEIKAGYDQLRLTILLVLISVILLMAILAKMAVNVLTRMNDRLLQTNNELESRVKKRTKELSDREARLSDLYQNSPVAHATLLPDGYIGKHNKVFLQLTGYSSFELEDMRWANLLPAEPANKAGISLFENALAGEQQSDVNIDLVNANGAPLRIAASAIRSSDGHEVRLSLIDITEREKALSQLTQNEMLFRSMVTNIPGAVFRFQFSKSFNSDAELVFISDKIADITGFDVDEFQQQQPLNRFYEIIDAEDLELLRKQIKSSNLELKPFLSTFKIKHRDDSIKIVQLKATTVKDPIAQCKYFDGVMVDITKQETLKAELLDSESRYRTILDSVADGVVVINKSGNILEFSSAAQRIFGFAGNEIIEQHITTIQADDFAEQDNNILSDYQANAVDSVRTVYGKRKNGDIFPLEVSVRESVLDNEMVFIGILRDITERHEQQLRLKQSEERLDAATYGARIGLWEFFPEQQVIKINRVSANMLGLGQDSEFVEEEKDWFTLRNSLENWTKYVHPDDRETIESHMLEYLHGQRSEFKEEMRIESGSASTKWILDIGRITETNHEGKPSRVSGVHIDITERKQLELDYIQAQQQAEEANRAKSDFLANMSHEIRTPMNAIIGMSHLALETELDRQQRNYIDKVHRSAESLLGIINDILDFSKIEAGKLEVEAIDFNLGDVLESLTNFVSIKAEEKHLELLFDIEPELPMNLIGDPLRLTQVLINLSNNAVKFTHKGEVIIKITRKFANQQYAELEFQVIDSGIGISPEQQARLFQPFTQADASTTRKHGGTGLGLAISNKLVKLMGGEIRLVSELNVGSNFSFALTFQRQQSATRKPMLAHKKISRVLIVDDNQYALEIFQKIINNLGYEASVCDNATMALQMLKSADAEQPYQLVLMDWQMPSMDGIEAVRALRNDLKLQHQPIVFMVTAYGREELNMRIGDIHVDDVLTKPVTASSLHDAISNSFGHTIEHDASISRRNESQEALAQLQGAHILAVEDNEINQELIFALLTQNGMTCDLADDGQQALEKLTHQHYDGILMDCQMPVMDGYTATKKIRQQSKYEALPIIAMTANAMTGDREKAIAVGMNDHIAKPVNVNHMFKTMAKWIKGNKQADIEPTKPITSNRYLPEHMDNLDVSDGLRRTLGDKDLYLKLLRKFHDSHLNAANDITQALANNDYALANRLAHTLKGLAGNIAAKSLQNAAADIEKQSSDNNVSHDSVVHLQHCLSAVITEISPIVKQTIAPTATEQTTEKNQAEVQDKHSVIQHLYSMLADYDSAAADYLLQHEITLQHLADSNWFKSLNKAIDSYDFEQALALLQPYLNNEQR